MSFETPVLFFFSAVAHVPRIMTANMIEMEQMWVSCALCRLKFILARVIDIFCSLFLLSSSFCSIVSLLFAINFAWKIEDKRDGRSEKQENKDENVGVQMHLSLSFTHMHTQLFNGVANLFAVQEISVSSISGDEFESDCEVHDIWLEFK